MNFDVEKYRVNFLIMERSASVNDGLDYSGDAAAGSFFSTDYKRNDDLKQMLDSNRDNLKLEAMKRIIGMVAKGRDASDLFPAVVKNVVSKNTEVKKLVYVYLMRYAEEQQDLALLSISTFQRALKDPNQLIRASALRVLSSIRVAVIVPIVMLAIRDASADMSPYVRKTAAHAIPKLYSLDPEQKDELIIILDKLLADKTTLVVGSAVMAFEEVCPDRVDMIHKNYRKLCALLVDVDEWGQVVILNMLTRYARSQFVNPNIGDTSIDGEVKPFYEDEENEDESDEEVKAKQQEAKNKPQMDPDHALLLKNSRPLLQSRNASVVMAVVQLYYHCAPRAEVPVVVKAMIRLLRSHVEVQAVVLTCIAAMSTDRKSLFEPYMKSFYVRSSDPTQIKLLKLEILTNIANETNIPPILREFQTYISSPDKKFVAATIQAIGRCASNIKEVAETCLNGLVSLLSHRDPAVVGGAVVVAKTLLQTQKSGVKPVIAQLARMVDRVTVPPARAAILWLLGEHCERLPHLPPDVLRKMAKTFPNEEDIVKLQIINLAAKLQLTNPSQTTLLCQYVLNLGKYDQSYDIRDRSRLLRHLLFPEDPNKKICQLGKKLLMSSKPAPVLQSKFKDRDHFQLGSLSHFLNMRANGYTDLPDYPSEAPDPSVRNVEPPERERNENMYEEPAKKSKKKGTSSSKKGESFYSSGSEGKSDDEEESGSGSGTEDSESDSGSESASSCCSDGDSTAGEEAGEKSAEEGEIKTKKSAKPAPVRKVVRYSDNSDESSSGDESSDSDESSESSSASGSGSSSEAEDEDQKKAKSKGKVLTRSDLNQNDKKAKAKGAVKPKGGPGKTNNTATTDSLLLLDFDTNDDPQGSASSTNANVPPNSLSFDLLQPSAPSISKNSALHSLASLESATAMYVPTKSTELLNKMSSGGLQIHYRFTRSPHIVASSMVSVELTVLNASTKETFKKIRIGNKTLAQGMSIHDFEEIEALEPGKEVLVTLGIDFNDRTQGAKMDIMWGTESEPVKKQNVTIQAPVGELIRAVSMSEALFITEQGKLRGMNEHEGRIPLNSSLGNSIQSLVQKVYMTGNLSQVPSTEDDLVRFAGQTVSGKTVVLVTIYLPKKDEGESGGESPMCRMVVNCEKIVIGSMLLQELKEALK